MTLRSLTPLTLLLAACQQASSPVAAIDVTDAWARATAHGQSTGAIYLTIANPGAADELVGLTTDRASMAMIHETSSENGVSKMRMLDKLAIPAGGTVELKPGGAHVMLQGAKPMVAGETFDLHLTFAKAGEQVVPVTVVEPGAR